MPLEDTTFPALPTGRVSERVAGTTHIQHDLRMPLRDGVELSLDLIRPDTSGAPGTYPVILLRTPYDNTRSRTPFLHELARRGYIVALNDLRGRFNSDGEFSPYIHDADDGYDVVEWVAAQDWCDGNVGMAGVLRGAQWLAAAANPPHLGTIIPVVAPPDAYLNEPITPVASSCRSASGCSRWAAAPGS